MYWKQVTICSYRVRLKIILIICVFVWIVDEIVFVFCSTYIIMEHTAQVIGVSVEVDGI